MDISIYNLIKLAQINDKDAMQFLIDKFMPLILKHEFKLKYTEAKTDLIIEFIKLTNKIDLSKFDVEKEGMLVMYINKALISRSINLFKKHVLNEKQNLEVCVDILPDKAANENFIDKILVKQIFHEVVLTDKQKIILINRYLKDMTDKEIARNLKISRQAVYENRTKAICRIKKYLDEQ